LDCFGPAVRIIQLAKHSCSYVTPGELAEYWGVSRKLIYRQINEGQLRAVRLSQRIVRINVRDAQQFESQVELISTHSK